MKKILTPTTQSIISTHSDALIFCFLNACSPQKGSSGEFEINEVVQSYERRLQEQVTLAKLDIISALESQIQVFIFFYLFAWVCRIYRRFW